MIGISNLVKKKCPNCFGEKILGLGTGFEVMCKTCKGYGKVLERKTEINTKDLISYIEKNKKRNASN